MLMMKRCQLNSMSMGRLLFVKNVKTVTMLVSVLVVSGFQLPTSSSAKSLSLSEEMLGSRKLKYVGYVWTWLAFDLRSCISVILLILIFQFVI